MIPDSSFEILNRAATYRLHKPFEWQVHGSDADRLISRLPFSVSSLVRDQLIRISYLDHFNVDSGSGESQFSDGFLCFFPSGYPETLDERIQLEWLLPDSVGFKVVEMGPQVIYLNVSASDLNFVSSLPVTNPVETLFDANVYIRAHPEVLEIGFQPLCGFHWLIEHDWPDSSDTRYFHQAAHTDLTFDDWMTRTREQADKWLAQTEHPPLWRPGFEPGTWASQ